MPKSRGRRKKPDNKGRGGHAPVRTRANAGAAPGRRVYDTGRVRSSMEEIAGLVLNPKVPPDLMVELLPAMMSLENVVDESINRCATVCAVLHYAYAAMGIVAHPIAVDLVTSDRRTGQRTLYGGPHPRWDDTTFHGHCVLSLPASGRFLDPTVEQYPEVRRYQLGPICGRAVAAQGTPEQLAALQTGGLQPGTAIGVERGDLLLLYTAAGPEYRDVVLNGPPVQDHLAEIQRAGRAIAIQTLALLAQPEVIDRARLAPHLRVRDLVGVLAGAEIIDPDEHTEFDGQLLLAGETSPTSFTKILEGGPR